MKKQKTKKISFKPIGIIRSDFSQAKDTVFCCEKGLKAKNIGMVILDSKHQRGLKGIEKFSHIFVLYYLDKIKKVELITYPGPLSVKNLPQVGVFASRSQYRPNKIALRLVKLVKVKDRSLMVQGLDGLDGSLVLDIKPYIPGFDQPKSIKIAPWYNWLAKNK
ncbi:tRNA (N6-threonylcarbamoyladenosine(37)-N6)-methyltransferase TrmO [Candidatus Beckwithbacteria bacterium CG10_big_fil_rev_8_21_14_0_10_34_10]|uniref:tRNA (N6-threonylcarbamoyladenosine(37)-N6)-methyltransferase TrmO n=1 Tax=Candidatus Beckwithbacteria bacterium CG10_big_fil_rev_8_21_14_0_10_34_10 TaxID=1974495 RepID=A0A2H0W9C1_9BACT|nr:MAG: tRNA (N6-threonylcarbamoyladenosine(37)-N6)-methyltransferase TrmO [Candidatus Beckwithbacteria bacterium CG10_big_fil_rev_8_21_14_0_10_34_10]